MREFVESGAIVLLALAVLTLETLVLTTVRRRFANGPTPLDIACMALPGACLLLALYCALLERGWLTVILALSLALPAHLADLVRRWRSPPLGLRDRT